MKVLAFLKMEFSFLFQSKLALIGYLFGLVLNLLVYYLTAKAFLPSPEMMSSNAYLTHGYFDYIVVGEMCLLIPLVSMAEGQESFFRLKDHGLLEQMYFSRTNLISCLLSLYFSHVLMKFFFIALSMVMSLLFFHLDFSASMIARFLLIQVLSSLFFMGLYFLNIAVSFLVGRRNSSFHHVINLLSFFSGAYFPLEIFHSELLRTILLSSPFALQVRLSRAFVYQGTIPAEVFPFLFFWMILPMAGAYLIYRFFAPKRMGRFLC